MLVQTDERTVRGDGYEVRVEKVDCVRYTEGERHVDFSIAIGCCGGPNFALWVTPRPEYWAESDDPLPIEEYAEIVKRVKEALEYLRLDFEVNY